MEQKIHTVIIEDEVKSMLTLKKLIEKHCPTVQIEGTASNVKEGTELVNSLKPELIFLDIAMPDGNGFELLENIKYKNFEVIFTTAYDQYAIKAIRFSALHYLLKPINYNDLIDAVERYENLHTSHYIEDKVDILRNSFKMKFPKVVLPNNDGYIVVEINDIVRCEASSNYTLLFLETGSKIVIPKSLSKFEEMWDDMHFARVHSKHLINLNYIKEYHKGRGGLIILRNGESIPVSASRKALFLSKLNEFTFNLNNA